MSEKLHNSKVYGDVLCTETVGHTDYNKNGSTVRYTETVTRSIRQNKAETGGMKRIQPGFALKLVEYGNTHKGKVLYKLMESVKGGKTGNIVFDSGKSSLLPAFAKWADCSLATAKRIVKEFENSDIIQRVTKNKVMINPYMVLPNQLGSDAVAQLQQWWDDREGGVIEWIEVQDIEDLKKAHTELLIKSRERQIELETKAAELAKIQDQHAYDNIELAMPILEKMLKKRTIEEVTPTYLRHYINKTEILKGKLTLHTDRPTTKLLMLYYNEKLN